MLSVGHFSVRGHVVRNYVALFAAMCILPLFLLHMMSKMHPTPAQGGEGSRIAIVFNGSPLFTGDAGSGESNIRRWIIENDYLEAIVALPNQMFYNTGIFTYTKTVKTACNWRLIPTANVLR